jgi:hypothetical protein
MNKIVVENFVKQVNKDVQRLEDMEEEKPPSIDGNSSSASKRKETWTFRRSIKNVCKPMESVERLDVGISRENGQIFQQGQEYNGVESTKVLLRIPWNT